MATTITAGNGTNGGAGISSDTTGILEVRTGTTSGAGTTAMTVDASQNVGIGTSSPAKRLTVANTTDTTTVGNNAVMTVQAGEGATVNSVAEIGFAYRTFSGTNPLCTVGYQLTSNAGVGAGALTFSTRSVTTDTAPSERMRIDTSGNVGIGTTSPGTKLNVQSDSANVEIRASSTTSGDVRVGFDASGAFYNWIQTQRSNGTMQFAVANTQQAAITSAGLFQFNSGYGSVATAYGCRAWVNFNGTGTVAIRASGNVSSITDNGTGDYTVNFTNAMPDANYTMVATVAGAGTGQLVGVDAVANPTQNTGSVRAVFGRSSSSPWTIYDCSYVQIAIFR